MNYGFIKCAAASPVIRVADIKYNSENIFSIVKKASQSGVKLLCLPELCLTGSTCMDLFLQKTFIDASLSALLEIAEKTKSLDIVFTIGLPLLCDKRVYNTAAVLFKGKILGFVPKSNLPDCAAINQKRYFTAAGKVNKYVTIEGVKYPFGKNLCFENSLMPEFSFGAEFGDDLYLNTAPSGKIAESGATIILNLSADCETVGKSDYRRSFIKVQSAKLVCGYIFANAGEGESTTDMVFNSQCVIAEKGKMLAEKPYYTDGMVISEIDVFKLVSERIRLSFGSQASDDETAEKITFDMPMEACMLTRSIEKNPFIPQNAAAASARCEEILAIQTNGLKKRFVHARAKNLVIGISGGLDSCLALIVCARTMDLLSLPRKNIIAVTMPCFGTSARTKSNAVILCELLGVTLKEICISESVLKHFEDIGHDKNVLDVTYENSQARERTQVLMDIANKENGIVVGTGDLSELALGWATYNGDQMSMYGVNASVPKTLVRYIIKHLSQTATEPELSKTLGDIAGTPVSPELLPPDKDGKIAQVTEDLVGPYELHDFYIYYFLRYGFSPKKILMLAKYVFSEDYPDETIEKWLRNFVRRFFIMQFKRSSMPDGPKVGSVSLSPRGDFRMPSDAVSSVWLEEF